ncbi:MAG: ester cyclase [Candidatus Puniceispirillales bacterium]
MTASSRHHADLIKPLRQAMYDFNPSSVRKALSSVMVGQADVHLSHPFGDCSGPEALYDKAYAPLLEAMPDLERRDTIILAGDDNNGEVWVGACGYYTGSFLGPFLGIPPTGHQVGMRFHEFFRLEDGQVVAMQAIWDLPSLMMQAGVWPMSPSLGREWQVPGPATQDGLAYPHDPSRSAVSKAQVIAMLTDMTRHPAEGSPQIMNLERYWHPRMNWYGPSGIGTARGLEGFRHWHQIPFLRGMPDRKGSTTGTLDMHFFAEGNYVAVTGWPNMQMSVTGDGWLGIAPAGQQITMRSLDFWRLEGDLIRENWVLIDLLDVYRQLGVDVLGRMREFTKVRPPATITLERDYA